jgi:hypothetical protein
MQFFPTAFERVCPSQNRHDLVKILPIAFYERYAVRGTAPKWQIRMRERRLRQRRSLTRHVLERVPCVDPKALPRS